MSCGLLLGDPPNRQATQRFNPYAGVNIDKSVAPSLKLIVLPQYTLFDLKKTTVQMFFYKDLTNLHNG